jgi:hypothetical protein
MSAMADAIAKEWIENKAVCFFLYSYDLQHEGLNDSLQIKGEHSSMVEDAPTSSKHGL